jgi:Tol biopolymer transport system component
MIAIIVGLFTGAAGAQAQDRRISPLFVAALGERSKTWSIVMLNPAAGGPQRLTDDRYDEIMPTASANGRYVLFLRGDLNSNDPLEYYLLDRDCLPDCQPRRLPADAQGLTDLRWAPEAPHLIGWGIDNAIWLIDVEADAVKRIIGGKWNAFPAWSPDGEMIVVASDVVPPGDAVTDDIQVFPVGGDPDEKEADRVNLTYSGELVEETRPSYSPDGQWIAYLTRNLMDDAPDPFGQSSAALLMLEAGCVDEPDTCLDTRQPLSLEDQTVVDFRWSPDSQFIAYRVGDPFGGNDPGELWVIDVAERDAWSITDTAGRFSWAPDSTALVYENITNSSFDVYLAAIARDKSGDLLTEPGPVLKGFRASATPHWAYAP